MPSNYEEITKDNIRRRGEEFDDIGQFISEQLYSDRTHFVYELIQNCEDAIQRRLAAGDSRYPRSVSFNVFRDRLEVRHFGKPFDQADIRGISDILKGTKKNDPTQIGRFGIGFKSVYALTSSPEVHSGDERFRIDRYIRLCAAEACQLADGETLFILPFNHASVPQDVAFGEISERLRSLGLRTLLFVRHLEEIAWAVEGEICGTYCRRCARNQDARRVQLTSTGPVAAEEEWLVFQRPVGPKAGSNGLRVEAAYRLSKDEKSGAGTIDPAHRYPLAVFFETVIPTGLSFPVQGPYIPTPARDNIHTSGTDGEWNRRLIEETAILVGDTLPILREMGLLSVRALEAMPIRSSDFPAGGMFRPIFDRVRQTLKGQRLLPAHDGGFLTAEQAKLARGAGLRELLSDEQLRQLFAAGMDLKWLSDEITLEKTSDLRNYLVKELEIEEVTPEVLARRVDEQFNSAQSDEWMAKFYSFLDGQKALWRAPRGPLRDKPFIRLEGGGHVAPFGNDGCPNAYLPPAQQTDYFIVKRSIAADETAWQFLRNLGLAEPDVVDEVINQVLPRYDKAEALSPEQHSADLRKIFSALKTDSHAKKQRLLKQLKDTPFIWARNAATGRSELRRPDEVYQPTDELETYFAGNADAWLLAEAGDQEVGSEGLWKTLGLEDKPRLREFTPDLSWQEKGDLRGRQGHTSDLEIVDCDLHGLDLFLERVARSDESEGRRRSKILWDFLLLHLEHRGGHSLFHGRYRWFYYKDRYASFDSLLIKRLRDASWLRANGGLKRPCEVSLDDLPDEFEKSADLAEALRMKAAVSTALAREIGLASEDIEYLRANLDEFRQWRAERSKPDFPTRESSDVERRSKRVAEQSENAPQKQYDPKMRSVRTSDDLQAEAKTYLRELYTNQEDQLVCQVCHDEMPFKLDDGSYYFEAVECVRDDRELRENHLALCPICAAKYKHANGSSAAEIREALLNASGLGIPVILAREPQTIRFVEVHLQDLRVVFKGGDAGPGGS